MKHNTHSTTGPQIFQIHRNHQVPQVPDRWHAASSLLKTQNFGLNCENRCYLVHMKWNTFFVSNVGRKKSCNNYVKILSANIPNLTLLWYHEKSYVNSTMGSIWLHCKKTRIKTQFITMFFFFFQIIFHNTGFYWNIDRQTDMNLS
jgi:hypothetical protein